jgi:hypothetical protein
LKHELIWASLLCFSSVRFENSKQLVDALEEAIIDYTFVFEGFNLMLALRTLLMNLILLCTDKRSFVDIGMNFDVGVITELQGIL